MTGRASPLAHTTGPGLKNCEVIFARLLNAPQNLKSATTSHASVHIPGSAYAVRNLKVTPPCWCVASFASASATLDSPSNASFLLATRLVLLRKSYEASNFRKNGSTNGVNFRIVRQSKRSAGPWPQGHPPMRHPCRAYRTRPTVRSVLDRYRGSTRTVTRS